MMVTAAPWYGLLRGASSPIAGAITQHLHVYEADCLATEIAHVILVGGEDDDGVGGAKGSSGHDGIDRVFVAVETTLP